MPLSVSLLLTATIIPRKFPKASPRLICQLAFACTFVGTLIFIFGLDPKSGPEIVGIPMFVMDSASGPSPHSSARSRSRARPTSAPARSGDCRTR